MRHIRAVGFAVVCFSMLGASWLEAAGKPQVWLYCPTNFLVKENVDKLETLWTEAAADGYTHVLIADSKFDRVSTMWEPYFKNCQRAKQIAKRLKLELVPAVFSVGYSNGFLANDPDLVEGIPVKDQRYVVQNGVAKVDPEVPVSFDDLAFKDETVTVKDHVATFRPGEDHCRMCFRVKTSPFHCYHISVSIRTKDLVGQPQIEPLANDQALNYQNPRVKPTQDWAPTDIVFNSLNNEQVLVYFGVWSPLKGELQWKDWKIEEAGPVNIIRRDGTPLTVKDAKSGKVLAEGTDFDKLVDPKMGHVPYEGEYEAWHEAPAFKVHSPDGTQLRVSWYHPAIVYDDQVAACISDPKTMKLMGEQARRVRDLWDASICMASHDEFRTFGWDESCQERHQTPGQILADNIRECGKLLKPARMAAWNDMFDPYHNAVKGPYYLVNGPWTGSWEGLDKDVLIFNWNYGKRDESLKFFADRGNEQIVAGFYDADLSDFQNWMNSAAKVKGVIGYMYTTWQGDYSKIKRFAEMALR